MTMTDRELAGCALLPCPFCGRTPGIDRFEFGGAPFREICCCIVKTGMKWPESEAIAAWNRRAPSRDAERPAEKGPFQVFAEDGKVTVASEDFTHDVYLWVTGDFASEGQHKDYAEWIADTLNAAIAAAEGETK